MAEIDDINPLSPVWPKRPLRPVEPRDGEKKRDKDGDRESHRRKPDDSGKKPGIDEYA